MSTGVLHISCWIKVVRKNTKHICKYYNIMLCVYIPQYRYRAFNTRPAVFWNRGIMTKNHTYSPPPRWSTIAYYKILLDIKIWRTPHTNRSYYKLLPICHHLVGVLCLREIILYFVHILRGANDAINLFFCVINPAGSGPQIVES